MRFLFAASLGAALLFGSAITTVRAAPAAGSDTLSRAPSGLILIDDDDDDDQWRRSYRGREQYRDGRGRVSERYEQERRARMRARDDDDDDDDDD